MDIKTDGDHCDIKCPFLIGHVDNITIPNICLKFKKLAILRRRLDECLVTEKLEKRKEKFKRILE